MKEVSDWFQDQNYERGVEIYSRLSSAKPRVLAALKKGRSDRNLATLCKELRPFKSAEPSIIEAPKPTPAPVPTAPVEKSPAPTAPVQKIKKAIPAQVEAERQEAAERSARKHFQKVKYGELPPELKLRFRELNKVFYDMCDLKFTWNELPDAAEQEALSLQLQIEALDEQRERIWKELEHWTKFRTMLPTKTEEDFSTLTPQKLYLKKVLLGNYIHKKENRVKKWEKDIEKETDRQARLKIQQQINNTLKSVHEHELNIQKIEELL